jgi:hypothetical protein
MEQDAPSLCLQDVESGYFFSFLSDRGRPGYFMDNFVVASGKHIGEINLIASDRCHNTSSEKLNHKTHRIAKVGQDVCTGGYKLMEWSIWTMHPTILQKKLKTRFIGTNIFICNENLSNELSKPRNVFLYVINK